MTLSPAGCSFTTETLTVTAALNDVAVSGWYKVGDSQTVNLNGSLSKEFTIGADMNYGDRITVSWGATGDDGKEYSGTATYTKVDPNASITIHVSASEAPNIYVWGTDAQGKAIEPAGAWPGKLLSETKEVNGTTYYYFTVNTLSEVNCIFNHGGNKTPDIKGITSDVFYKYDGSTKAEKVDEVVTTEPRVSLSPNGGEFYDDAIEVTIRPVNCVSAWYSIDGGDNISLSHDATVTIGADKAIGESVVISWSATDASDVTKTGSATFTKVERPAGKTIYFDNSIVKWNPVNIYFYPEKNGWPGQEMEKVGEYLYKYVVPEETTVIVFNGGSNNNQTNDIKGADIVHNAIYQATGGRDVVRLSGVEGVEATQSHAPVEYYNLQGIRVDNPANGIYIRRCGNVVTKVRL